LSRIGIQAYSLAFNAIAMSDEQTPPPEVPTQQAATPATTIDELIRAAFFVASGIDAPAVDTISPTQVNLHYPADGSLVSIRIESRPGAWGGIGPHGTPEDETARNEHYDEMKAAAAVPPPPPEEPVAAQSEPRTW
jgi:hypothetical protein